MYDYDGSVKEYIPRVVDHEIAEALTTSGALVLQGARAVGKTESSRQVASSELRLDGTDPRAVRAREQPATSLAGEAPRLLEEWQFVTEIWNEVRHAVMTAENPDNSFCLAQRSPMMARCVILERAGFVVS